MKKTLFFLTSALVLAGCCKDDNVPQPLYVIDFEDARVQSYLAGPTSYGENLYSEFGAGQYIGYNDAGSGLSMMINEADDFAGGMSREFWNGGIAISQWNDMATEGYRNQCSVYYKDVVTGFGGYNGSKTFAVVSNGFTDSPSITFADNTTECKFDHFRVTNTTYAVLSMRNGDNLGAKKFSYEDKDWFKLVINAFDKNDNPTGKAVEFYLADFRTATSAGIITKWTKVDLTPLGSNVHTIKFYLQSSDTSDWGMNTPGYFCFDDLAIFKSEK